MTDVATVTSQVTAKHMAGAKGAGASAGTGTVLDGAFAALLGAAGQGSANGEAVADGKPVDPALIAGNPTVAVTAGIAGETGEAQTVLDDIDSATDKPRKASRGKDAKGDDTLLQTQAALVVAIAAPPQDVPASQTQAPAKAGGTGEVGAIDAAVPAKASAATLATTTDVATAAQALSTKGDKPAKDTGKTAPAIEPAAGKDQAPAQSAVVNTDSGRQGDQPTDRRGDNGDRGSDKTAAVTLAANDDSTAGGADPLRDIVQSLPPVVQAQLAPVGGTRVSSTGDLLSSHAIDMSVSGQWIDRMAREIATVADGSGNARFQLSPPNLGRIQVELLQADDQTNVRILAETDEAARRLREGQAALEAHARVSSLSLGSVSVEKSSAPFDSGDKQNQRQGTDPNANSNQQNFAQAQGQSAQGKNNSNGNLNRDGFSAVMGNERQGEPEQGVRTTRASDPRVRFA
ncbi:MAG: flagellar hook-length control protein FliK [Sphingobium sp.]|nr:flagellar hook-length control protein FliK [Sphingobium sp.]